MTYLNLKTSHGTETVDELDKKDFPTFKAFRAELSRLVKEYRMANMNVYRSQRCANDWK